MKGIPSIYYLDKEVYKRNKRKIEANNLRAAQRDSTQNNAKKPDLEL